MASLRASAALALILVAATTTGDGQIVTGGISLNGRSQGVTGLPYTATRTTTTVQKLANGTTITRTSTTKEARDSQGRTMSEVRPFEAGELPQQDFAHVTVMDPVGHIWMTWTTNNKSKQANLIHIPDPAQRTSAPRPAAQPGTAIGIGANAAAPATAVVQRSPIRSGNHPEVHREQLDGKMVGNVYAEGVRVTTTIPTGMMGNDQPLVTVSETWTSPDLHMVVLRTSDDPRSGQRTEEVTDLNRNEPDPSLFQPPPGYTVKEQGQTSPE